MELSTRQKGFLILSGILLVFSLLVMNDVISVLEGAEAYNLLAAQSDLHGVFSNQDLAFQLPKWILLKNYEELGFNLFLLRLPNVLLLILTMLGFFGLGRLLFGEATIWLALLVIAGSFLIVTFSKFVVFDSWLMAFEILSFLSLMLLLKQPLWKWRILFWIFTLGAVLTDPKSALVFTFGMYLFLIFAHPDRKRLIGLFEGAMWLATISIAYFVGGLNYDGSGFFFNSSQITFRDYSLINLAGVLPWFAFLPAAILDLFQKLRKREEMAIILFTLLLFSFLSFGLVLQIAFALLIAKQIENFFKPGYPHTNLVKTFAVFSLLFSFLLVAGLLLTGYDTFATIGFRTRMGLGGVYWAFSFLAIIGLFGKNKEMIIGSMALSGLLAMFLFWTQISPLLENYRNFSPKLTEAIEKLSVEKEADIYLQTSIFDEINQSARNDLYFKTKKIAYQVLPESETVFNRPGIFVLEDTTYLKLDQGLLENLEKIELIGQSRLFAEERKVWIVKK